MMDDLRFQRLPKWAQEEIHRLQVEAARLSRRVDEVENQMSRFRGEATSETLVRILGFGPDKDVPLDEGVTVQFKVGPSRADYLNIFLEHGVVGPKHDRREEIIGVSIHGGGRLKVTPKASNSILISGDR